MKKIVLSLTVLLALAYSSKADMSVKGKGGVVVINGIKYVCPKPSPYVCAVIKKMDGQPDEPLSPGNLIEVTTTDGEQHTGIIQEISGKGDQAGEITFK